VVNSTCPIAGQYKPVQKNLLGLLYKYRNTMLFRHNYIILN